MTVQEFYQNIYGNYNDVLLRIPSDELVLRFIKKFLEDKTFSQLQNSIQQNDIKQSFEYAHKLKGITANLSFTELNKKVCQLCEQLRPLQNVADEQLFNNIEQDYKNIIAQIQKL